MVHEVLESEFGVTAHFPLVPQRVREPFHDDRARRGGWLREDDHRQSQAQENVLVMLERRRFHHFNQFETDLLDEIS